jgi:hypothetical protein
MNENGEYARAYNLRFFWRLTLIAQGLDEALSRVRILMDANPGQHIKNCRILLWRSPSRG